MSPEVDWVFCIELLPLAVGLDFDEGPDGERRKVGRALRRNKGKQQPKKIVH